jgi:predicted DNA-binding antitoxin AbrB/MazE fold protein
MPPIEVIYENGVFRPIRPVQLPEGVVGQVLIAPTDSQQPPQQQGSESVAAERSSTAESPGQRALRLLMEIAALPHTPPDEQSDVGARHDDILYPKRGRMP